MSGCYKSTSSSIPCPVRLRGPATAAIIILCSLNLGLAQRQGDERPAPLDKAEGAREATKLLVDLLAPKPAQTNTGVLRIRAKGAEPKELKIHFEVRPGTDHWISLFEAKGREGASLAVIQAEGKPNQYLLTLCDVASATNPAPRKLAGGETMIPFAASDFWVSDLGLEFFHWPQQRVLRREMKRGQSCDVLESVNPAPVPGGYARVLTWIDLDSGGIVYAEAYDSQKAQLKEFAPKKLKKVRGEYQLESMVIRNPKTDSSTLIEFDLGEER
jgi:hypothetical protein